MPSPPSIIILFTTGDDTAKLRSLEAGFIPYFQGRLPFEFRHLGNVKDLPRAYHKAALSIVDPDALMMFCHQDVKPLFDSSIDNKNLTVPPAAAWLKEALENPLKWLEIVIQLCQRDDTGIMGVAGARGLFPETAWWYHPDLTGAAAHEKREGEFVFNAYGPYGRAAVLDGLCLILLRKTYDLLGEPPNILTGYHFYDMDLCLRAHFAGLKNWTIPLMLLHSSGGAEANRNDYRESHRRFLEAYEDRLPVNVPFEPLPIF